MSVMGNSEVVLFDEPTSGLDPESRRLLWNIMLALFRETHVSAASGSSGGTSGGRSRSCVLTTHSLEEAEALCSRIAIMLRGHIYALGACRTVLCEFTTSLRSDEVVKLLIIRSSYYYCYIQGQSNN